MVYAPDALAAAELASEAFGPASEVIITDNLSCPIRPDADISPLPMRVVMDQPKPAVHFIGFRGEEFWSAVRIWGFPDVVHRVWDYRAQAEIVPGDLAVFAKYGPDWTPSEFSFNDSEVF